MRSRGALKDRLLLNGFTLLEDSPPDGLIVGLVCKPWLWTGEVSCYGGPEEWLLDNRKEFAKIVMVLGTADAGPGRTLVYTETRVFIEDKDARKRFSHYWWVIKPFSGFMRLSWLRTAKRHAERRSA